MSPQPPRHIGFHIRRPGPDQEPEHPGHRGQIDDDQARRLGHSTYIEVDLDAPGRHVPFEMTRGEPQDDPTAMSGEEIQEFARRGGLPLIVETVREIAAQTPTHAGMAWPTPLHQRGLSCQTVAIINGLRCYQAVSGEPWNPGPAEIDAIRVRAGRYEGEAHAFDMKSAALILRQDGRLGPDAIVSNPIEAAAIMATFEAFAVVTSSTGWHATTVVPNFGLRQFGSKTPPFISIDSLTGTEEPMGAKKFCRTMLAQNWAAGDETLVCSMPGQQLDL